MVNVAGWRRKRFRIADLSLIPSASRSFLNDVASDQDLGISLVACVPKVFLKQALTLPGQYILPSTVLLSGIPGTEQATKGSELSFLVLDQSSNVIRTRICPVYYLNDTAPLSVWYFFFILSHIIFVDNCMLEDTTLSANSPSLGWFE